MSKVSVFGASGFIGSRFCEMNNADIIPIERHSNVPLSNKVLYFISTTDNYNVLTDPHKDINTNLHKLVDVLEECKKIPDMEFTFISSWFVYGKGHDLPVKEDAACRPSGFYSITKYAAERMVASYCDTFGIKYRILRLTNIIGGTDRGVSPKKNAIQNIIEKVLKSSNLELYDGGSSIRDFMFVDDCVRAITLCLDKAPFDEVVNISNSEPKTILDIVQHVQYTFGKKNTITSIEIPKFHQIVQTKDMWLDNTKLRSYGYVPQTTVLSGINDVCFHYLNANGV